MATVWRILLGFSLVILGFAAGAWIGGHFLVAPGAGLAGPVEALGYGAIGAIGTVVLSVLAGGFRLQGKQLRAVALALTLIATAFIVLLVVLVVDRKNSRPEYQATSASPGPVTSAIKHPSAREACTPTLERDAATIAGSTAGERAFRQSVGPGWTFVLQPAPYGWEMRLLDHDGLDLSQMTPPYRLAPNPRELYGWHFRNAANTGPNIGAVNAPQQLRTFQFSPSLTGTGGFKPSAPFSAPDETQGRGLLTIVDMRLSDLQPGTKARMEAIKFVLCLTWPKNAEDILADE